MTNLLNWLYVISYILGIVFLALLISELCISFAKGLKAMFGKIKKPKFKFVEMDFSKHKKQDNYPVEIYLNNAMRYLLVDPVFNSPAISELTYAMTKGQYEIQPDVMLKLSECFPDWRFPKEE